MYALCLNQFPDIMDISLIRNVCSLILLALQQDCLEVTLWAVVSQALVLLILVHVVHVIRLPLPKTMKTLL